MTPFPARQREGILWLHGFGNVFEVTLAPGEEIDIEPGGWIYKDRTVQMQTMFQKLSTGFFASAGTHLSGTGSPARAKSPCNPCISTWKAGNKLGHQVLTTDEHSLPEKIFRRTLKRGEPVSEGHFYGAVSGR